MGGESIDHCNSNAQANALVKSRCMINDAHSVGFDDGLIVILWRSAATYTHAKHIRAEMLNSNTQLIADRYLP